MLDPSLDAVRRSYDDDPEAEWHRLEGRLQNRIEYLVTSHAIANTLRSLGPGARILDAGGGPGRYTRDLTRQGFRVALVDLSRQSLKFAARVMAKEPPPVRANWEGAIPASFSNLSFFRDDSFDAVVSLGGALSHLLEDGTRDAALQGFARITRPGGSVVVSFGNRLSALRGAVTWPDAWVASMESVQDGGSAPLANGSPYREYWPEELGPLLSSVGLEVETTYGCQGIAAHLAYDRLDALFEQPERWTEWREWLLKTADRPSIVGLSCHLIVVARRPT